MTKFEIEFWVPASIEKSKNFFQSKEGCESSWDGSNVTQWPEEFAFPQTLKVCFLNPFFAGQGMKVPLIKTTLEQLLSFTITSSIKTETIEPQKNIYIYTSSAHNPFFSFEHACTLSSGEFKVEKKKTGGGTWMTSTIQYEVKTPILAGVANKIFKHFLLKHLYTRKKTILKKLTA